MALLEIKNSASERPAKPETSPESRDVSERFLGPGDSMASSPHTFHNALKVLRDFVSNTEKGNAAVAIDKSPEMERWLAMAKNLKRELDDGEFQKLFASSASTKVEDVNQFLESRGFSIRLKDTNSGGLYVASVFKQKVEWGKSGKETTLSFLDDPSKRKEAVKMENVAVHRRNVDGKTVEVYELKTKDGSSVFMMPSENVKTTPLKLYETLKGAHLKPDETESVKANLTFPKVNFTEKGSMEWIKGARIGPHVVNQAEFENRLTMDKDGATAESAVAMGTTRSIKLPPREITLDRPFYVWFEKNGVLTFTARIGENALVPAKR